MIVKPRDIADRRKSIAVFFSNIKKLIKNKIRIIYKNSKMADHENLMYLNLKPREIADRRKSIAVFFSNIKKLIKNKIRIIFKNSKMADHESLR